MSYYRFTDTLIARASSYPDRVAIETRDGSLTYSDLIDRATQTARALLAYGVKSDSHVGIAARNNTDILLLVLASWMIGTVVVPIDFRTRISERKRIISAMKLSALICDESERTEFFENILLISLDNAWNQCVRQQSRQAIFRYSSVSTAIIKLTSGTSGEQLGIIFDHDRLLFALTHRVTADGGGRLLNPLQMSFSSSLNVTLSHLLTGGTVIFLPAIFSGRELADAIVSLNATSVRCVPLMVRQLIDIAKNSPRPAFPNLVQFHCAGSPLAPSEKVMAFHSLCRGFTETYSSTMTGQISQLQGADINRAAESVGRILPGVFLQTVDENDNPLPIGRTGRIRVRSPGMANGFFGNLKRTSGDRIFDGWVYTGDFGLVDADGFLRLHGRDSDMVIRGGENIHPAQIEAVGTALHGVHEIAVAGYASQREGEELAAFIVADHSLTEHQVVAHFRSHLRPSWCPRKIVFVSGLPRNNNGKVIKTELREQLNRS